ncbi:AfsR/SARP family transcriptional regulator [Actinophytocola algeriensis]|uniref:DNA-binding SARP family transcriptional activator n=1 Tax=Actinophytocola algeriensis TaxID=1768010 RepID=A0A7W7VBU0_9PSEU|nr:BTAD domain-containing putative transcriptional regulator [Actinophytocola algeriensis]MBB4904379.1 DNA-binding SARP family transcriptional activator [Actinophytocola algeriensis]MBE1476763.1 DNA-binding SARP family transcriptional activator [Actinophytocola algeriensis]
MRDGGLPVRYRMLGNVAAHDGVHWQAIAAPKPRALLAALLIRAGDVLTVDQLLFELWGDRPPRSAPTQIHGYILRIRRVLGEVRARSLLTTGPGYRLVVEDEELDTRVFARLSAEGREALRDGDAEHAAELLGGALALWQGPVLADVPASPLVSGLRRRLSEDWHLTWESRVEADLALGRHAGLIEEIARHVEAHPLRERPWRQLMLALDRAGRRDDAVSAYQRLRSLLVDHSGIEPGLEVRRLYDDLRRPRPHLVPNAPKLVGRAAELAALDTLAEADGPVVTAVTGPAGIGKTAFVRHWAGKAKDRYPDGRLYADLEGYGSGEPAAPAAVLATFLQALGVPADAVPADEDSRAALYRSRLSGARVLIVLDNARDADQVRPLLPGPSRCMVVVTSRDDLRGLTATHGAHLLRLPVLEPAAAVALLGGPLADVAELAALCGHLPLALRIAARKLAARTPVSALVAALRSGDLDGFAHRRAAVRAAFDASYRALPEVARHVFRLLGLTPGHEFSAHAVAALGDLPVSSAAAVLDRLAAAHMVEPAGGGRFTCHDLLRRYALELAPDDPAATRRLADHYLATARHAATLVSPGMALAPTAPVTAPVVPFADHAAALLWLDAERANLVAVGGWRIVDALRAYLAMRSPRTDWAAAARAGLAAAVAERSLVGEAAMEISLGRLAWSEGRYGDAKTRYSHARTLAHQAGWHEGESTGLNGVGRAEIGMGRPDAGREVLTEALGIDRAVGFRAGEARELHDIGLAMQNQGLLAESIEHQERALALCVEVGDLRAQCLVADALAWARQLIGQPSALKEHTSALALGAGIGWEAAQSGVLRRIAAHHRDAGRHTTARDYAERALALVRAGGEHQLRVDALTVLGDANVGLGQHAAARRCYTEALGSASTSGYLTGRMDALLGLAELHVRSGEPGTAEVWARTAVAAARASGLLLWEGRALTVLASAAAALGRRPDAARFAAAALAACERAGHHPGAAQALSIMDSLTTVPSHAG